MILDTSTKDVVNEKKEIMNTCNSEASQPGPSSEDYTNDETTGKMIHEKNTTVVKEKVKHSLS